MKEFFDTSVWVAAFWRGHPNHDASLKVVSAAQPRRSASGLHTLAEIYATMTALPVKDVIPPDQVLLFIQEVRDRCTIITLTDIEYFGTLQHAAERGLASGRIYDALLLRCAMKSKADLIYTWNLKHFRAIEPKLASKIRTP